MAVTGGGVESKLILNCNHFSLLDQEASPSSVSGASSLPTFLLMHLVSLVGQVALQQVAYLEVSVSAELRRRRILKEEQKTKKFDSSTTSQRSRVRTELGGVVSKTPTALGFGTGSMEEAKGVILTRFIFLLEESFLSTHHLLS